MLRSAFLLLAVAGSAGAAENATAAANATNGGPAAVPEWEAHCQAGHASMCRSHGAAYLAELKCDGERVRRASHTAVCDAVKAKLAAYLAPMATESTLGTHPWEAETTQAAGEVVAVTGGMDGHAHDHDGLANTTVGANETGTDEGFGVPGVWGVEDNATTTAGGLIEASSSTQYLLDVARDGTGFEEWDVEKSADLRDAVLGIVLGAYALLTLLLAYTYSITVATPKPLSKTEITAFDIKRHSQLGK